MSKLENIPFQVVALPVDQFSHLFSLSDTELLELGARRCIVDTRPGYPCRVSLTDAQLGERVILVPFTHHETASPYQASGPIFVREQAEQALPEVNEVPEMIRRRLLSIRAYDSAGMMVGSEVIDGSALETQIQQFFASAAVEYLHVHNARPGCFNCRVDRA